MDYVTQWLSFHNLFAKKETKNRMKKSILTILKNKNNARLFTLILFISVKQIGTLVMYVRMQGGGIL